MMVSKICLRTTLMQFPRHFLWKITILAGLLSFSLFSTLPAFSSESPKTRVDGNWIILNKKVVIDASIETLARFLKDVQKSVAIVPGLNKKTVLKQISKTERIDHDHFKLPKPFKDRYVVYQAKQKYDIGREILFTLNSIENYPFEDEGKVRGVVEEGRLLLQSHGKDETRTHLTVIMRVDPGGFIPVWLINLKLDKLTKDLFKKLNKNIQKEISRQRITQTHWTQTQDTR